MSSAAARGWAARGPGLHDRPRAARPRWWSPGSATAAAALSPHHRADPIRVREIGGQRRAKRVEGEGALARLLVAPPRTSWGAVPSPIWRPVRERGAGRSASSVVNMAGRSGSGGRARRRPPRGDSPPSIGRCARRRLTSGAQCGCGRLAHAARAVTPRGTPLARVAPRRARPTRRAMPWRHTQVTPDLSARTFTRARSVARRAPGWPTVLEGVDVVATMREVRKDAGIPSSERGRPGSRSSSRRPGSP